MKKLIVTSIFLLSNLFYGQDWTSTFGEDVITNWGSVWNYDDDGYDVKKTSDGGFILTGSSQNYLGMGTTSRDVYLIKTDESGQELWTQTFGGSYDDYGTSVQETSDGGYIITGSTYSYGNNLYDVYLIKTDESGQELWTQTFGGSGNDYGNSVQETSDGGYIITGSYNSNISENIESNLYLIKTDENGNELWSHTFYDSDTEWFFTDWIGNSSGLSIQQTTDQGYIVTGYVEYYLGTFNRFRKKVCLVKFDELGEIIWEKDLGIYLNDNIGTSIQQTSDGGYIITGETRILSTLWEGEPDVYLIKTDENGNELWSNTFGGSESDYGTSVRQTSDGGYIITGGTKSYGNNVGPNEYIVDENNVYLIKTNNLGQEQWFDTYNCSNYYNYDVGRSVEITDDGGYVVVGSTRGTIYGTTDVYLIKVTSPTTYYNVELGGCDSVQNLVNNSFFYESGTYVDIIPNNFNGDSVITQHVEIDNVPQGFITPDSTFQLNESLTNNGYYNVQSMSYLNSYSLEVDGGSSNYNMVTNTFYVFWDTIGPVTLELTETTPNGCVNTSSYEIIVLPPNNYTIYDLESCDSVQNFISGNYVYESTTFYDTLINQYGGDSVLQQNITVYESPDEVLISGDTDVNPMSIEYYVSNSSIENNLVWNIQGGEVFQNFGNIIEVLWMDEGVGVIELTETTEGGCSTTSILEVTILENTTSVSELNRSKKLIKTINILGNEITPQNNTVLIQFYDDGSVEKKIIIK